MTKMPVVQRRRRPVVRIRIPLYRHRQSSWGITRPTLFPLMVCNLTTTMTMMMMILRMHPPHHNHCIVMPVSGPPQKVGSELLQQRHHRITSTNNTIRAISFMVADAAYSRSVVVVPVVSAVKHRNSVWPIAVGVVPPRPNWNIGTTIARPPPP